MPLKCILGTKKLCNIVAKLFQGLPPRHQFTDEEMRNEILALQAFL